MNPVDHPHGGVSCLRRRGDRVADADDCHRVTTNISVKRRPSPATPPRARRPVSLPREGRVCCAVLRRRSKRQGLLRWSHWDGVYCGLLASIDGTAASMSSAAPKQVIGHLTHTRFPLTPLLGLSWKRAGGPQLRAQLCDVPVRLVADSTRGRRSEATSLQAIIECPGRAPFRDGPDH